MRLWGDEPMLKPKVVNRSDVEAAIRAREVAWGAICKGILSKVSRYEREALREHYVEADKHLSRVLDWREDFLRGGGRMRARELTKYECQACDEGWTDRTIGGDGYGNRCAGLMDVPTRCYQCGGTGIEEAIYRKARLYPLEGGDGEWTIEHDEALYPTLEDACTAIDDELDYPPPPKGMSADEARATW